MLLFRTVWAQQTPSLGPPIAADAEIPQAAPADAAPAAASAAGWKNGFFIQSPDKAFFLRITGQIQGDMRAYANPDDRKDIDTFLVRRARLGIEATVFDYFEFRLLPDFGQGQSRIQDSYINVHYVDWLQIQAGKFKEPVSYEELIQDRFVPTMERSLIDQIVPARDVGVMIHGQKLLDDRFDYAIGIFNGGTNGDMDTNDSFDGAARVVARPFKSDFFPEAMQLLQIGISGTFGQEREPPVPSPFRTPGNVPWLQFNPAVVTFGTRTRWTPEVSYFFRGFGCAAQFLWLDQEMRPSLSSKDIVRVPMEGSYFLATYLLTGEERTTYSQAVKPLRPFHPAHPLSAPGAWELVVRVSHLRVDDRIFDAGPTQLANPDNFSSSASELTLGFNWYLNDWVRMQFNWEHSWFGQPVNLGAVSGPKALLSSQDAFLTRLQVIF
jgi:phosphate-selective porin OprO and OprP